jgi:hypothetical protein
MGGSMNLESGEANKGGSRGFEDRNDLWKTY